MAWIFGGKTTERDTQLNQLISDFRDRGCQPLTGDRVVVEVPLLLPSLSNMPLVFRVFTPPGFPKDQPAVRLAPHPQGAIQHPTIDAVSHLVRLQWRQDSTLSKAMQDVFAALVMHPLPQLAAASTREEVVLIKGANDRLGITFTNMCLTSISPGSAAQNCGLNFFTGRRLLRMSLNPGASVQQSGRQVATVEDVVNFSKGREVIVLQFEPAAGGPAGPAAAGSPVGAVPAHGMYPSAGAGGGGQQTRRAAVQSADGYPQAPYIDGPGGQPFPQGNAVQTHMVPCGTEISVLQEEGAWARVRWGQREGFVRIRDLNFLSQGRHPAAVPEFLPPPPPPGPRLPPPPEAHPDPPPVKLMGVPDEFPELTAASLEEMQSMDSSDRKLREFIDRLSWTSAYQRQKQRLAEEVTLLESQMDVSRAAAEQAEAKGQGRAQAELASTEDTLTALKERKAAVEEQLKPETVLRKLAEHMERTLAESESLSTALLKGDIDLQQFDGQYIRKRQEYRIAKIAHDDFAKDLRGGRIMR